jgi:hypothetical protein
MDTPKPWRPDQAATAHIPIKRECKKHLQFKNTRQQSKYRFKNAGKEDKNAFQKFLGT